jgi:hypothetical protein
MFGWFLGVTTVLAGPSPGRCDAVWTGPVGKCEIQGVFVAAGTGKDIEAAGDAALARLLEAVEHDLALRTLKSAGTQAGARMDQWASQCPGEVKRAVELRCAVDPTLAERRICYADFDESACWSGDIVDVEGRVWKAMEQGRNRLCSQVDPWLESRQVSQAERHACSSQCLQGVRVRCPETNKAPGR